MMLPGRPEDRSSRSEQDAKPVSHRSTVRRIRYDAQAQDLIAETLDVSAERAPFQLSGAAVWQLLVPGARERPAALVTLWPSLRRVDIIAGPVVIVFTDVTFVDLVPGVEVQFRRGNGDYLIVARGGKVVVRA